MSTPVATAEEPMSLREQTLYALHHGQALPSGVAVSFGAEGINIEILDADTPIEAVTAPETANQATQPDPVTEPGSPVPESESAGSPDSSAAESEPKTAKKSGKAENS